MLWPVVAGLEPLPGASFTATAGRNFSGESSSTRLGVTGTLDRWEGSVLLVIMRRWNRSSPCYRKNVLDRHRWESRGQLRKAIVHWVERVYHRKRRQLRLAKLTPVEYELVHEKAVALAVKTPESTEPSAVPLVLSWLVSQIASEVHIRTVTGVLLAINTV